MDENRTERTSSSPSPRASRTQPLSTRPSIYSVAELAGVSHMTVSRVLNGGPLKESTRSKVLAAMEEVGYRPSSAARALATRRTMRVGVIVHEPTQFGPKSTLIAIERAARDAGYAVTAYSTADRHEVELERAVADLNAQGVDAVCVIGPGSDRTGVLEGLATMMPVIVVDSAGHGPGLLSVGLDHQIGANLAMDHLLCLGHRSILHLAGPLDTADAQQREKGWRESLRTAGWSVPTLIVGDWSSDFGFHIGAQYDLDNATAVFAANDQMALGLVHGLWTRGIRVPHDVSVVGFDDLKDSAHFIPPLTTVRQDFDALGRELLATVLTALRGRPASAASVTAAQLIVRESTGRPCDQRALYPRLAM